MAERDVFNFDIQANNQQAKEALQELKHLAKEVSEASGNLKASPALNKNFSSLIKEMTEAQTKFTDFKSAMDDEIDINLGILYDKSAGKEARKQAQQTIDAINRDVEKARKNFKTMNNEGTRAITNYERTTGKKARVVPKASMYQDEPNATERSNNFLTKRTKSIESETREALRIGRSALSSRFINNNNASTYKRISDEILSEDVQGASIEQIRSGEPINNPKPGSLRHQIIYEREQAKERGATLYGNMTETVPEEHAKNMKNINDRYAPEIKKTEDIVRELEPKKEAGILNDAEAKQLEEAYQDLNRITRKYTEVREEEITRFEMQMSSYRKEFDTAEQVIINASKALDALDESAKALASQMEEVATAGIRQSMTVMNGKDEYLNVLQLLV